MEVGNGIQKSNQIKGQRDAEVRRKPMGKRTRFCDGSAVMIDVCEIFRSADLFHRVMGVRA
jgi:hypothetical protein